MKFRQGQYHMTSKLLIILFLFSGPCLCQVLKIKKDTVYCKTDKKCNQRGWIEIYSDSKIPVLNEEGDIIEHKNSYGYRYIFCRDIGYVQLRNIRSISIVDGNLVNDSISLKLTLLRPSKDRNLFYKEMVDLSYVEEVLSEEDLVLIFVHVKSSSFSDDVIFRYSSPDLLNR